MARQIVIKVGLPDLKGDYDCSALIEVDGKPLYGGVCKFDALMKNIEHYVKRLSKEDSLTGSNKDMTDFKKRILCWSPTTNREQNDTFRCQVLSIFEDVFGAGKRFDDETHK